jgi:hypothetical protein
MHIFAAYEPTHRCFVPSCDGARSVINATHTEFTVPKEHAYTNIFMESAKLDPCRWQQTRDRCYADFFGIFSQFMA